MSLADAVVREAAWLATYGDGLPALLSVNGGPFDVVQPYAPRSPVTRQTQLYVLRRRTVTARFSQQRRLMTHTFQATVTWPIGQGTTAVGLAETEQQNLDDALGLLIQRLEGFVDDKSHGGRFMSVGEAPNGTQFAVEYGDPVKAMAAGFLTATVAYTADDGDYIE